MSEHSTTQSEVCNRFGVAPCPVEAGEKVGIALASLGQLPLTAVRYRPENGTCGWYIWCGDFSEDVDFFQPMHVVHLTDYCPQILPYLSLPPGWKVMLAPDYEDCWFEEWHPER